MRKRRNKKKWQNMGVQISDKVSHFVGTWTFVFLYTVSMIVWIVLHLTGVLHIDSADFIKWNLWLSYFAGTQASIVLMSQARASHDDRKRQELDIEIGKKTLEALELNNRRMSSIVTKVDILEDLFEEISKDDE